MRLKTLLFILPLTASFAASAADDYTPDPDAQPQPDVPKGQITKHTFDQSNIFPGATRDYWAYVPSQYDAATPAPVMVFQDGIIYNAPVVFDNLIHKKQIPALIGVFVMHGRLKALSTNALDRFNRSYEYDGLGDNYARFLLDELLPHIAREHKLNLSTNANDRAIAGSSSGAICAFTAAWERPDAFRRVFSSVGTFVGLRGGNNYPTLIRKTEPKPIRVFLQDGANDLNIYAGNWFLANQEMLSALEFAGYDVNHAWGDGGHNHKHATAIFPEALRWLWRDYPVALGANPESKSRQPIMEILVRGEDWQPAAEFVEPAQTKTGPRLPPELKNSAATVAQNGNIYLADPGTRKVWLIGPRRKKKLVDTGIECPSGVCLSPDQSLLYVADKRGQFVYSFQIQSDGSLAHKQRYFHLHLVDGSLRSGATGMAVDTQGRLYVATELGIQVCDQAGRVNGIILKPHNQPLSGLAFGGPGFDTLYVACGGKVYKRKTRATGVASSQPPIKPPAPRL